jgi:hypothetical protein
MILTHAHTVDRRMALSTLTDLPLLDWAPLKALQKPPSDSLMVLPSHSLILAEGLVAAAPNAWDRVLITDKPSADEAGDAEETQRSRQQRPAGTSQHPDPAAC